MATLCHASYIGHGQAISSQTIIRHDEHNLDHGHNAGSYYPEGHSGLEGAYDAGLSSGYGGYEESHYDTYNPLAIYAPTYKTYVSSYHYFK